VPGVPLRLQSGIANLLIGGEEETKERAARESGDPGKKKEKPMVSSTRFLNDHPHRPVAASADRAAAEAAPGGFVCPVCKCRYGDPLYHGPAGHAPVQMCFDCWASEWGTMIQVLSRGGNWQQIDSALFLMCQGFKQHEAARLVGMCRQALHNWIRQARQKPHMIPDWLIERARSRERVRA